ncbi:MAG: tetratricopeptide repeat protein [Algoriphagus sp.]|nr:tetratricopeptide repeat protein [Algoriphagus sp.]
MVQIQENAGIKVLRKLILSLALLLFLFLGISPVSWAQNFAKEIKKIELLQDRSAYDSALLLANKLLAKEGAGSENGLSLLLNKQISFYYLGKYDSMRQGNRALLGKIEASSPLYPNWRFVQALLYGEDGAYHEAIRNLKEAEVLFQQRKMDSNLAKVYNSLGGNFKEIEEYAQAKVYYKKGKSTHLTLGDSLGVVMANNNLGSVYRSLNQLDSAIAAYLEASTWLAALDNTFLLAQNQLNIGNVYEQKGDLAQAETYFANCLALSEKTGVQYGVLLSRLNLGNLYRLQKNYTKSEEWLNIALSKAKEMGLAREKSYALERLSWLARDTQDYERAYLLSLDATKIKDSLLSESVKKESLALQERYESERKSNEILVLEAANQQFLLIVVIGGIVLFALLSLVLYGMYRRKRLLNEKLISEAQQQELSRAIQTKDLELTAQALQILQIKKLLEEQTSAGLLEEEEGNGLKRDTFEFLQTELENRITESNGDFYKNLLAAYPDLKPTELKLCSYLRLNLSTKELAEVLNKSVRTIENTRFSIRKKMGLGPEDNLVAQLIAVEEK